MSSHTIVYLDVNYLSNMAKARLGHVLEEYDCQFWDSLFNEVQEAVLADKVACPGLEFQLDEADFDSRIEPAVWEILCELSLGLKFNPWETIRQLQIEDATFEFMGKKIPEREPWAVAFKSDPQEAVARRMQNLGRIRVHLAPSGEIVQHDRQVKKKGRDARKDLLRLPADASFHKELLTQKLGLVSHILGSDNIRINKKLWQSNDTMDKLRGLSNIRKLKEFWSRLEQICITNAKLGDFLSSDELLNTAYVDIFSSISTAIFKHYKARPPKGSDSYDIGTLATVLPYCDVITTDKFMKNVLVGEQLRFDKKYKCKVFSCSKTDRQAFRELIRQLK